MRGFYGVETALTMTGDNKAWEKDIADDHKDICCEDDYDDEEDDDEKEWCD